MRVAFIRHGEPDFEIIEAHRPKYSGPRYDLVPLSKNGIKQVEARAAELRRFDASLILSSPYTRTLHTAAILSRLLGLEIIVEPELHDWLPITDFTAGLSFDLVAEKANEFLTFKNTGQMPATRTWETEDEMRRRAWRSLEKYKHSPALILITHEAVIQAVTGEPEVPCASIFYKDIQVG